MNCRVMTTLMRNGRDRRSGNYPVAGILPQQNPYYRGACRTGRRPVWHHKIHIHGERPSSQQALAEELAKVDQFIAGGGTVQKLPPGLAVDFDTVDSKGHPIGHVKGKTCAAYGADGELLWVVSSRPQAAWDNEPGGSRYPDSDLFADARCEGKEHASFAKAFRRGLLWLQPWQSKETPRFAVKFYNCGEDSLLPGKKNGTVRLRNLDEIVGQSCLSAFQQPFEGRRDCRGPAWEMWTIGAKGSFSEVEPGEVRNDTRDLMARWAPPSGYF